MDKKPEVGKTYEVCIDDCCIALAFAATLIKVEPQIPDHPYWEEECSSHRFEFGNGVVIDKNYRFWTGVR